MMVIQSYCGVRFYVLILFLLSSYVSICGSAPAGNADIFENSTRPEIHVLQGNIQGVNLVTRRNRIFFGFKGIPFAQPPIGNLRFKGPVPAGAWNGTLDGSIDSPPCPQLEGTVFIGNEDCLYLNVYTPRLPTGDNFTLLPVMLFAYGGGHKTGTNNPKRWGPQFILDKDVVLLVPNYRMGPLGYLSTGDEVSPGNYGLKDLVRALEWTRDNVRYFGGDPNQVTVHGGSSGAACVHLLTMSNSTNGLFHRYILQSGNALGLLFPHTKTQSAKYAAKLGEHLGCPTNTSIALVNCLRTFNASQLVDTTSVFTEWFVFPYVIWGPSIEPETEEAFITDTPRNLYARGMVRDLPSINLVVRDEGIVFSALFLNRQDLINEFLDKLHIILPYVLQYENDIDNMTVFADAVKSYYFNNLTVDQNIIFNNFSLFLSDLTVTYFSHKTIQEKALHTKSPQYFCSFNYRGTVSYSYFFSGGDTVNMGVAHGDELLYLLPGPKSQFGPPGYEFSEADWKMVDTMVQLWTSFAATGTPTTLDGSTTWMPYSRSLDNYLQIGDGSDTTLQMKHGYSVDRFRFLDELLAAVNLH
ncbi:esterase E4-like [Neodiprion virginianus]|uniref:esterase E4-like n=1 Tax=Neodiprion virginianus TaxID=2961670 RepID=UPI001EE696B6|nr:esterase E4-like [Neodiprion virginianus]